MASRRIPNGVFLSLLLAPLLSGSVSTRAATTNFNWIATSPADYSVAAAWDLGIVPDGSIDCIALITNGGTVNYTSGDNYLIGQLNVAPWDNSTGYFHMTGGSLVVSNNNTMVPLFMGGHGNGTSTQPNTGNNSVAVLQVDGGSLTIARNNNSNFSYDGVDLGLATNSSATFTINGGIVTLLCGMEIGQFGSGTVNLHGGVLIDNSWFGIGRGASGPFGSGTVNITNGTLYLVRNVRSESDTSHGFYFCRNGTNGVANISGGTVYCNRYAFANNSSASETLNISGGTIYVGSDGVSGGSATQPVITISGGVFHTVDMVTNGVTIMLNGNPYVVKDCDTNSILPDGTNWAWTTPAPVNLTPSIPGMGGVGYATFAPEPGRTITLDNVWTGDGGLKLDGPGTLAIAGNNTYTGNTTVQQGTLAMVGSGSIAGSSNIIVQPGATFSGPTGGSAYTLGASQTLTNNGSTPTLAGNIESGPGTISLSYSSGTPAFTVVNGTLGLSTSTTFIINNTGATLGSGSYKIISAGSGGSVTTPGGLPTAVTVAGGGIVSGQYASLNVSGNELYLVVTSDRPPVIANVVTNNVFVGLPWQIAITNLRSLAGWSDPDGDPITLSSVGPTSANGTNITSDGIYIYYNGGVAADDHFNYTITDGQLSTIGAVYLQIQNPTAAVPADTNYAVSLDGTWRFYLEQQSYNFGTVPNITLPDATQPFQQLDYVEGAGWTNITVPGNWEMYGFSPCTYFSPDNTSGLYRNWIQVPSSWQGRRVYLSMDGVFDGAEIWLNGQPVPVNEPSWNIPNYHESGWTSFQVDLTGRVNFGTTNLLAVRVIKKTPSVDLETGDYFVLGGIYAPVTMYSVPTTNIADVQVETHLLSGDRAQVDVTADITGGDAATPVSMNLDGVDTATTATNGKAVFTQIIDQPRLWSAEFPNLYDLTLNLKDPSSGLVTETVTNRIGIREITITNGVLEINGEPVKFAGVCDHSSSAVNGSAVDLAFWRKEIKFMKAANINAIRTTHYPPDPAFYQACDELGMYVADELPYCWVSSVNNANMKPAFDQRARETIRRDRNHPCVVEWAIGNENNAGVNLQTTADLVKSLDPSRPRSVSVFNASTYNVELSDSHYPSIGGMINDGINGQNTGHPYIFLENPNTWDVRLAADPGMYELWGICLQRTWDVCEQYDSICGTFPFEWSDRSVQDPNPDSDYSNGSVQRLYSFPDISVHLLKIKGMVDGFRDERASVYEAKMVYSPIQISNTLTVASGQVSFPVQNRYSFTDLSYLTMEWALKRDGQTIAYGNEHPSLPPLTSGTVQISIPNNALTNADTLRVDFIHPDGDDVVAHQFTLKSTPPTSELNPALPAGLPIPQINLVTRANYSNPGYWTLTHRYPSYLTNVVLTPPGATTLAQLQALTADVAGGTSGHDILGQVQAGYTNNVFSYRLTWTGTSGNIQELGWAFPMPSDCDHFSWDRNSRWTVYPDYDIGRARGTATPDSDDVEYPYMYRPDAFDFGSTKYDCNWAALTTASGDGLRVDFSSQQRFHCKAGVDTNSPGYVLYVNQQVSPPNDFSQNVVSDLYMTLNSGNVVQGSFTVGSNSNLVSTTTGTVPGDMNILFSPGGGSGGSNQIELNFTGSTNASYSVWASTNLLNWEWEGPASEITAGQYQFFDLSVTNETALFYRVSSP